MRDLLDANNNFHWRTKRNFICKGSFNTRSLNTSLFNNFIDNIITIQKCFK